MSHQHSTHAAHPHGTVGTYVFGFLASLVLTVAPYLIVIHKVLSGPALVFAVVLFAVAQLVVQMVCFLHLSPRKDGRWNLITFAVITVIVFILVIGTLWVMNHLAANMTPMELDAYLHKQN